MHVRLADESVCIGAPTLQRQLSQHPGHRGGLRDHRRRRGASRLRLPGRERPLRRDPRGARHHLYRPDCRACQADGRQDQGQGSGDRTRHPGGAGVGLDQRFRGGQGHRARHRLSGAGQGCGRRRRPRHEARAVRERARAGARHRPQRGARRVRRRYRLSREISRPSPPYRDPGAGRRPGQRHPSRRARLLAAAAPPEALGGGAIAGAERERARAHRRDRGPRHARPWPIAASARSSSSTRAASSISSR